MTPSNITKEKVDKATEFQMILNQNRLIFGGIIAFGVATIFSLIDKSLDLPLYISLYSFAISMPFCGASLFIQYSFIQPGRNFSLLSTKYAPLYLFSSITGGIGVSSLFFHFSIIIGSIFVFCFIVSLIWTICFQKHFEETENILQ